MNRTEQKPQEQFKRWLGERNYPCVAARTALAKDQIEFLLAGDLRNSEDDDAILDRAYEFLEQYRKNPALYSSLVVLFPKTPQLNEVDFESALWARLQALHEVDARRHGWDISVSPDPASAKFGFSLGGKAFFIIGMHPKASRASRRFQSAALVFNLHDQFERLRATGKFPGLARSIRDRDRKFSGSVNPMLAEFGEASEALQYSGRKVDKKWRCPFHEMN